VHLFPNPASDYLHVRLENTVDITTLRIALHNIIGNEIPVEIDYIGSSELRIRVKEFSMGYYLLALHHEESNFKGTYKFLKR
jgi:Secretion system C-terminal sorting domain